MFADLISPQPGRPAYEAAFVREVRAPLPRDRRLERFLIAAWLVIGVKQFAVVWAVRAFAIPFSAWWVNAPTLALAATATLLYLRRSR